MLAGYLWWSDDVGLHRVPATGGAPEAIDPDMTILASTTDELYGRRGAALVAVAADGTSRVIVDDISPVHEPMWIVVDDQDVYWRELQSRLYRTAIAGGGTITEIPDAGSGPFAAVPGGLLVDFTRWGYRTVPR